MFVHLGEVTGNDSSKDIIYSVWHLAGADFISCVWKGIIFMSAKEMIKFDIGLLIGLGSQY